VRFNSPVVVIGGLSSGHPWVECPITTDSPESPSQIERIGARVLGIADGSRSEALRQLSVSRVSIGSRNQRLLVARFARSANDVPRRPGFTFLQATQSAGGQLFLACLDEVETSLIVNVPPDRLLESPDGRQAVAKAGAHVLGIHGRLDPTSISVCEHTVGISRRMTIGNRVFVMGDAACSASPYTGLGLNVGIRDAIRFGSAVRRHLKASNSLQLAWARVQYAIQTWSSVAALLAFSAIMLKVTRLPTSEACAKACSASRVRACVARASSVFFLVFLRGLIRSRLTGSQSGLEAVQKAS
jgi:2-polyprenyl-6-methoxyphenol hydroxylase-like FAD-dependent oxidoreductase